ncbi:MAG: gas vesicle protein K [Chloroflexi bacterium]|nr:gas vesicle protein K [Chloroflexota bacterium]
MDGRLHGDLAALGDFAAELARVESALPQRINADESKVEHGLAKLVLTLIELVRRLLEKQAIRRIDAGSLTDDQIERMGETFYKLEAKMAELKLVFNLADEELNLNLGPLGDLL